LASSLIVRAILEEPGAGVRFGDRPMVAPKSAARRYAVEIVMSEHYIFAFARRGRAPSPMRAAPWVMIHA